jgi:hypothetical protein
MKRYQYSSSIEEFSRGDSYSIYGKIVSNDEYDIARLQQDAWIYEIELLQEALKPYEWTKCYWKF